MKKNVKTVNITLTKLNNISPKKNKSPKLANGSILSSNETKISKNNFIFNKKKLNKNIIPNSNSKCYIKKLNNNLNKQKKEFLKQKEKFNKSFSKKIQSDSKRPSLSLIKKNKNSPLRLSNQEKKTPEKNASFLQNKSQLNFPYNNKSFNGQKLKENNYNIKTKKISIFKDKINYFKNGNKIVPKGKDPEIMPIYHKKIDKNNRLLLINKVKNNIINISSDNVKGNISYYKQIENNINRSQIIGAIGNDISSYNKEIQIKNVYYPRSPLNKSISFKNNISPIKKVNLSKSRKRDKNFISEKIKKIKISSDIKVLYLGNNLPNNYGYHEIIHKNSPKKRNKNNNVKEIEKYKSKKEIQNMFTLRNDRPLLEELTSQNDNYKRISTTILINNQSYNNSDNKILIPNYSTLNSNKNTSLRSSHREDNVSIKENLYLCSEDNIDNFGGNRKLFLSPKTKKLDISGQYNEIETENEDVQTIHYFGEEMLKRNKNYNFEKINEMYQFPIDNINNTELKRNNSSNDINNKHNTEQKNTYKSIPFSNSYNNLRWKQYSKRDEYYIGDLKINKRNKRYNHNIINRKKKKKLIMEKSQNEQFISIKKQSKTCDNTKDKFSCCESSINLDNDSINDIINEFEKEIENEEKKDKFIKDSSQKKLLNIGDNNDGMIYSFASENDNFSNMSKGSTNDSKVKKKKVRYYKTKNFDMEKNYDFFISPTKIRNIKK